MLRDQLRAPIEAAKPRLRGKLHQFAFFVVVPAGVTLVTIAPTGRARLAAAIYALSLAGLYGTSTLYHRMPWSPKSHRVMKKLDHSMIFVLIAGTYTPLAVLVLHGPWKVATLSVVWGGAAVGILLKFLRVDGFSALTGALYIALGWMAIVAMPEIVHGISGPAISLLFIGGVLYTGGAIVLARNRPNPAPGTYGYHEVWHTCVIAATACHYVLVMMVTLGAR
jgi:hemolysin III